MVPRAALAGLTLVAALAAPATGSAAPPADRSCSDPSCLLDTCLSQDCGPVGIVGGVADGVVCALLPAVPAEPGVVDVAPDGDLYVAGQWTWDCPPYGEV